jgi:hypothetical protein
MTALDLIEQLGKYPPGSVVEFHYEGEDEEDGTTYWVKNLVQRAELAFSTRNRVILT